MPADEPDDLEPPAEMKPGARAIQELHDHLTDLSEVVSRVGEMQENPEVQKFIDKFAGFLDKLLGEAVDTFGALYPEHGPLGPSDEEIEKSMGEKDEPEEEPEEEESEEGFDYEKKSEGMGESEGEDGGYMVKRRKLRSVKHFKTRLKMSRHFRDLIRTKRMSKNHHGVITKAAEHLETAGDHEGEWGAMHKAACHYHAKALRGICKSFTAMQSGTAGDLERGGVPEEIKKSLAELAQYRKKVPVLLKRVGQMEHELKLARKGR